MASPTNDASKGNLTAYEINGKEYEEDFDLDNRIIKVDVENNDVEYRYDAFTKKGNFSKVLLPLESLMTTVFKHAFRSC